MDPSAVALTLRNWAFEEPEDVLEAADALSNWLDKGGFPPEGMTRADANQLIGDVRIEARKALKAKA